MKMWVIDTKGTTPYSLSMKWPILKIWRLMIMVCKRATALHSMRDHLGHKLVCSNAKALQLDILSHLWTLQSKILAWKITARWIDINIITQMGKLRKRLYVLLQWFCEKAKMEKQWEIHSWTVRLPCSPGTEKQKALTMHMLCLLFLSNTVNKNKNRFTY